MTLLQIVRTVGAIVLLLLLPASLVGCGSTEDALIGAWRSKTSGEIWTFNENGTMSLRGTLFPAQGIYEFVEDDQITITLEGLAAVAGPQLYTVKIDGDDLTLTWHPRPDFSGDLFFTRLEE